MTTSRDRNVRFRSPDLVRDREEILYDGELTRVTRVFPADGGRTVIRKESFGADALGRLRHERRILQRLVGVDGVPRLIDARSQADSIMMEDPNARAIPEPLPLDKAELMRLALGVTRIVGAVHRRGVVHGDINTNSILLAGNDRSPLLIDFHFGTLLSDERLSTSRSREIVGSLPYFAPERTGRTGRRVDQRSDLYALGATLYELATGRPPFGRGDPLRLVHDHLARVPTAPADLNRRIPRGLSDIIMRLLEKDPDSRYQSAEGLAYDLVMVRDTLDAGPNRSLVLGTRDFAQQLPSPSPMVDRGAELETLRAQFTAAMHGPDRGILIVGNEGIGRATLVEQLRPTVNGNGGWMVTGRSDQYRQDPRSDAVWQALRALGRSLVTESEEDLAAHRKNIRNALGHNAGLIANILPEFGLLLKVAPDPAASQDQMAERRLQQSSVDLIRTIVSTGRPLVLVLDDLQWAGPTALGVIDALLTDHSLPGLLVVGTYSDAEVTPTHPLTTMLSRWRSLDPAPREIRLSNLSAEDLVTFLQEMLRLPRNDAAELAQVIWVRSHGNPYDTVELINALRRDGALVQQEGGWCWDVEGLRRYIGHGDVKDLLATRLDALAPLSVGLLDVLACLGEAAEVILLADASGEPLSRVEQLLAAPLADGLVVREDTAEPCVRFRHDRVRQAVSGRLTPAQRTDIHLTVARRLAPVGQFASVAAEQYLAAIDTIDEPDEIRRVVDLLRRACREVRPVNPATAERCLSSAIGLLRTIQTPADTDLVLALQTEEHSVLNLLGRHNQVDQVFSAIQRVNPDPKQLADAVCVQVSSLCDRGRDAEGVELGLDLLRQLGIDAPREPVGLPTEQQWAELEAWVAGLDLAEDLRRPEVKDPRELAIAQVIKGLTAAALFSDSAVVAWLVFESQRLWVKDGPSRSLAASLGLAGSVAIALRHDYRIGYPILRHLLAVCEARDYEPATSFVRGCMPLFTSHWFEPLENNVEQGLKARDGLMKAGLMQSVCYTYYATMGALLDTAPSIDALDDEVDPAITLALSTGNSHAVASFIGYRQLLRAMRGQTDGPGSFNDSSFDETTHLNMVDANPIDVCLFRISRSLAAAIFGDLPTLIEQSSATMSLDVGQGGYRESLAHLFHALALAQRIRSDPRQPPDAMLAEIDTCREWLSERAADAPFNYLQMVLLVDAERAWAVGDTTSATAAFDAALTESETRSRPWHHALIAERAALYHLDHGLEYHGRTLMAEARRRYDAWGATAKVAQLDRTYPFLRGSPAPGRDRDLTNILRVTPDTTLVTSDALDLLGLLQASQALSSERSLDRLRARVVDTLSEMTGATSVQVLMWDNDIADWVKPADLLHGSSIPVEEAAANGLLPLSAFRYAERTREPLLVDDATRDYRFAGDRYFKALDRCSLLIMPVLMRGEPRAMLILENNLSRGAFPADRLAAVNLIVGQLSVSLDNALIYSSLERKVSERTKELEIANGRLEVLAETDALTGLANRRRLIEVLEVELLRSLRTGSSTGVIMMDIDFFKAYNDRYGHVAGDVCLRRVAEALQRSVRTIDVIARYGGEEFAIVLPDTDLDGTNAIAERAQSSIIDLHEQHLSSPQHIVTVSIGIVSQIATLKTTAEQLLDAADGHLYQAKRRGRNQIQGR